jgi:hypothetical protein
VEPLISLALATIVGVLVGYLAGYSKRKGENLAMHEDIDKLVDQVAAVTTTTKEIEAKITSDMWDRQKRWELRREVLFEATRRVAELDDALLSCDTILQLERKGQKEDELGWAETKNKKIMRCSKALTAFDETRLFVGIVCGGETKDAFEDLGRLAGAVAGGILRKDSEIYQKSQAELTKKLFLVRTAIRKELGIAPLNQPPIG